MADLRDVVSGAGFTDVSTYLQTGNVLFETTLGEAAAAVMIEESLAAFGLKNAPAVVRSLAALETLVSGDPFAAFPAEDFTRFVTLFREPLTEATITVANAVPHVARANARELLTVAPVARERGLDTTAFLPKKERMLGTTRYLHVVEEVVRLLRDD